MSFEDRNAQWGGQPREFHQVHSRSGTARVWTARVDGNVLTTSWGQFGGKMQTAQETFNGVNEGKTNYVAPAQYALERAREYVRKKAWEGYREVVPQNGSYAFLDPIVQAAIDFDALPLSLSFYKPDNSLSAGLEKKAREGKAWYTRKRNGMMKVLCKNSAGELQIYSRRMLRQHDDETETEYTWDDRFPHIIHAIEPHIPPRTILLGELVVEEDTRERFDLAQSYIKSLTPKAVADMETSGLWPFFYCWDIAFWGGEDLVSHKPMRERYALMRDLEMAVHGRDYGDEAFVTLNILNELDWVDGHREYKALSPEEATEYAKMHGWEGFVVVDPDAPGYGDKAYNFKGKPDRPAASCGKLKPAWEDDFIALWNPERGHGERSTKGSRNGGIKSVGLFQYNPKGELVWIANVSSGLTKEMLGELADPSKFPQVWKVEYTGRRYVTEGDDTNALDFPRYIETRTDKTPNECVNEKL